MDFRRDSRACIWVRLGEEARSDGLEAHPIEGEEEEDVEEWERVGEEEWEPSPRPSPSRLGEGGRIAECSCAFIAAWWARSAASLRVERDWRWSWDSMVGWRAALMD